MSLLNQAAPDFTLINSKQEEVSLSEYVGKKIVLAFYPAAFSGICDQEMCVFEKRLDQLNTAQACVFGISPIALSPTQNSQRLTVSLFHYCRICICKSRVSMELSLKTLLLSKVIRRVTEPCL